MGIQPQLSMHDSNVSSQKMMMHQGILWGTLFSDKPNGDAAMLLNCFQADRIRSDFCQHQDDFRSSRDIQGVFKDFKGQGRFKIGIDRLCSVACEAAGWASTSPGIDTGAMVIGVVDGKFHWKSRGRNHQKPSNSYSLYVLS